MAHPGLWGWSTGPLTIHFWGWENASSLNKRFQCAPRLVHAGQLPWVTLDEPRSCIVAAVTITPKSVCGSYPSRVTVASGAHVPGICREESAHLVSCCRSTPKVQNNACVEKVVKWKAHISSSVSAWPAVICDANQRRIPRISI